MKKNYYLFAAIVIVAATVFAVVSCNKDSERQTEKNAPAYEPSEMDKAMMDFGQKLKAASNERSGETMPLAEALNTMTNYQNFSMCDASNYSLNMLADTIHATLNVVNGEVLLSELNRFYQATEPAIMSKFNSLDGDDKAIYLIRSVVAENQRGDLDNYSGNLGINVITRILLERGPSNPLTFNASDYWNDFDSLGKCGDYQDQCIGRDCVTELQAKLVARRPGFSCEPGYRVYFTNSETNFIYPDDYWNLHSPNKRYALPWRDNLDSLVCVTPSEMTWYLDTIEAIFSGMDLLKPVTDFTSMEGIIVRESMPAWRMFIQITRSNVNCIPFDPID